MKGLPRSMTPAPTSMKFFTARPDLGATLPYVPRVNPGSGRYLDG